MRMGAIDTETKAYLADTARVADACNFLIYGGEGIIKAEELHELDTTEIALPYGNGAKAPTQKFRDVLKLYTAMQDGRAVYLILGLELQSKVHYAFPVRGMLYDAINYAKQVSKISAAHRSNKDKMASEEFLSGFCKDDRIIPVITIVILFSPEKWDGPVSLHEMLAVQDSKLLDFVPDYKINLISPAEIADMDFGKFQTGLGAVMQFIKHQNDESMEWIKEYERFENVDFESASVIKTITGTDIQIEKGESVNMCKAWENSLNKARQDAKAEGRNEGESVMLQALQMLKDNASPEDIRRDTGCSMESIAKLKSIAFAN